MRRTLVLVIAAVACLSLPAAATAAACPRTSVADIEDEVMCPVCGTPLGLATEAPQAKRERAFILDLVERCRSKDEIKAALVAEFGEGVLAAPDDGGARAGAVLVPAVGLGVAGLLIAVATMRWRRGRTRAAADPPAPAAPLGRRDSARLESDLERYDL